MAYPFLDNFQLLENNDAGIPDDELAAAIEKAAVSIKNSIASHNKTARLLLVVPDFSRFYSNAGRIANLFYHSLNRWCRVDILVALGTHVAMTEMECELMYGDIPFSCFTMHNWRFGTIPVGQIPGSYVSQASEGLLEDPIEVEINRMLMDGYDLIISIGQVVPHEVAGMASHAKNILVGCGGASMINSSHIVGAFYGLERIMGRDHTPVRDLFDYAMENFLSNLPICYTLTVATAPGGAIITHGLFIGQSRSVFEEAVALAQKKNITFIDKPFSKAVVYLEEQEYKSTWIGNKSIYRSRMAIARGGELIILAGGVDKFGEDPVIDSLIRKYGYVGREQVIALCRENQDLRDNLSAAAHLIHGSNDGYFTTTYCTSRLSKEEIEAAHFHYAPYSEMAETYNPKQLSDGYNTLPNGETIYFISNPSLGLWVEKSRF